VLDVYNDDKKGPTYCINGICVNKSAVKDPYKFAEVVDKYAAQYGDKNVNDLSDEQVVMLIHAACEDGANLCNQGFINYVTEVHSYLIIESRGGDPAAAYAFNAKVNDYLTISGMVVGFSGLRLPSGRRPANYRFSGGKFAGKTWTKEMDTKYPKGVMFSHDGFPDFSPYAIDKAEIKMTGIRDVDEVLANKATNRKETPTDYTWHHSEDRKTMYLIPSDIHDAVRHAGGVAMLRDAL
jgi:hypothetical protein